ncbi:ribonuclease 3-like [Hibiscus syriacus]|uniref:Ribonuclease 3-like n=1 Tax=Hibiscus syriacus TaxID=106335 RepID=A0A6A2YZI8_HIBSY|nr:transcription factor bHLH149-like [Hibiscus syriacus]KAE8685024.1 ribonuclease 3-like [Hibiscus syriacus]
MASFMPNLDPAPDTCPEFKRRKRRIIDQNPASHQRNQTNKRWRTQRQQHIYSSKLIQALRRSRRTSAAKEVHETADRVLAVLARGTTRWSRAILTSRKISKHKKAKVVADTRLRKPAINREKRKAPVVQRKLKLLARLVPGCRKLSFTNLLEETSDYIAALEMQVRAMTAITEFLAGGGPQPPADRFSTNVNS